MEREYDAANVLNSLAPLGSSITLAETAVRAAQRRKQGKLFVYLSGAALVFTLWLAGSVVIQRVGPEIEPHRMTRTETIPLTCLSPQQAGDLIEPYLRSNGSGYHFPGSGIAAITVRAREMEIDRSRQLIAEFETNAGAACRTAPGAPTTPGPGSPPTTPTN